MAKDPFEIVLDSIKSLKGDISDLYEKYNEMNRLVWIKLTELETSAKEQRSQKQLSHRYWQWIIPLAVSIVALGVTILEAWRKVP